MLWFRKDFVPQERLTLERFSKNQNLRYLKRLYNKGKGVEKICKTASSSGVLETMQVYCRVEYIK